MMKKVVYNDLELEITYRNDVIFKNTLASNDEESEEILTFILEAVTGGKYRNVRVTNTESLGRYFLDKRHYLDIRAEDEEGNIFNIEMQQSEIGEYDMKRFQGYNYRIIAREIGKGESYEKMRPSIQIVFTTEEFSDELVSEYRQRTKDGEEMEHNLASFYFISLPKIEKIIEEKKGKEELTDLEAITYIYQNGSKRAIMDMTDERQKRVMGLMEKKYEESTEKEEVLDEATQAALYEHYINGKIEHYSRKNYAKGMQAGIEKGIEKGMQEGIEKGTKEGLKKGKLEGVQKLIRQRYNEDASWLEGCTIEQIDLAFDLALEEREYEELKSKVLSLS